MATPLTSEQESILLKKLQDWIDAFQPAGKRFCDFNAGMRSDNPAYFAYLDSGIASEGFLSWHDGLMGQADVGGYWYAGIAPDYEGAPELELEDFILQSDREWARTARPPWASEDLFAQVDPPPTDPREARLTLMHVERLERHSRRDAEGLASGADPSEPFEHDT